jgi:molybdopterin synthase sulfur carrier subunit
MSAKVRIPAALRPLTGGRAEVAVAAGSLRSVLDAVAREAPGLGERILDESGALRRHVNVFVNDEDVRFRELLETPVQEGDRVAIVPAIAGGRAA